MHSVDAREESSVEVARRRARRRLGMVLATGLGVLALMAATDFLPSGAEWFQAHPMTASAISTVMTFVAVGLLVGRWVKEREAAQLYRISTVAYRSLAQAVNDVGRSILAPVVGADLHALAIPSSWGENASASRARLRAHGFEPVFEQQSGSWRGFSQESHGDILRSLLGAPEFVALLFRCTATERRRLHEATAVWAPVMLTSEQTSADLGRLRALTDAMELVQEHARDSGAVPVAPGGWVPDAAWLDNTSAAYWGAVACYEQLRDEFGDLADLPSDAVVHKRRG